MRRGRIDPRPLHVVALVSLAVAAGAQDARWEPLPDAALAAPVTRVEERLGSRLEVEDGRLVRQRRGAPVALVCSLEGGPGEVHDLAADPAGRTFVAADAGVFTTGPEADTLDLFELGEGAPTGRPTSVAFDARRRLWVATETGFGAVDPNFGWGSHEPAGTPAPPYRIAGADGEGLLVETGDGPYRYRPDARSPPSLAFTGIDGVAGAPGEAVSWTHGHRPRLDVRVSADGPVALRYRVDGHHVWRHLALAQAGAVSAVVDLDLDPGSREIEVVAFDADLNASPPVLVRANVRYPFYYRSSFVAGLGAALLALTLVGFHRFGRPPGRLGRAAVSTILLALVGLQVLAGVIPHGRSWPFMGYTMYTESAEEGAIVYDGQAYGVDAKQYLFRIPMSEFGVVVDSRWQVLAPIVTEGRDTAARYIERWNERHPQRPIHRLQVRADRIVVTGDGPRPISPLILADHDLSGDSLEGGDG